MSLLHEANRLIAVLQNLNIPAELSAVLDDLTAELGSGAKAWVVVIKWLSVALVDQFVLSRHSERLLRLILKSMDADALDLAVQRVEKKLGPVGVKWGPKCRAARITGLTAGTDDDLDDYAIPEILRKRAD